MGHYEPDFEAGRPVKLFEADFSASCGASYDVAPDAPVIVVRNWTAELLEMLEE